MKLQANFEECTIMKGWDFSSDINLVQAEKHYY